MCKFIGIDCVAGNAIVSLFEKSKCREITFEMLISYGLKVAEIYTLQTSEEAIFIYDEFQMNKLFSECSGYFSVEDTPGGKLLRLNDSITSVKTLKERFQYVLSLELIRALLNQESLCTLGAV